MALQPIVDLDSGRIWGHEALVRGVLGETAPAVLAHATEQNRSHFDQLCRAKAIELAASLLPDDGSRLTINFQPAAIHEPAAGIHATLTACARHGFDPGRLTFELTENEPVLDLPHVESVVEAYRDLGCTVAIDDFGAGYAGLNTLAMLWPDIVKIDMHLVRGIATAPRKQAILRAVKGLASELGITLIAEGVETDAELATIRAFGINLAQGYLFARPEVAALPRVYWPQPRLQAV